jgi:hypothetical protein
VASGCVEGWDAGREVGAAPAGAWHAHAAAAASSVGDEHQHPVAHGGGIIAAPARVYVR